MDEMYVFGDFFLLVLLLIEYTFDISTVWFLLNQLYVLISMVLVVRKIDCIGG